MKSPSRIYQQGRRRVLSISALCTISLIVWIFAIPILSISSLDIVPLVLCLLLLLVLFNLLSLGGSRSGKWLWSIMLVGISGVFAYLEFNFDHFSYLFSVSLIGSSLLFLISALFVIFNHSILTYLRVQRAREKTHESQKLIDQIGQGNN